MQKKPILLFFFSSLKFLALSKLTKIYIFVLLGVYSGQIEICTLRSTADIFGNVTVTAVNGPKSMNELREKRMHSFCHIGNSSI